MKNQKLYSSRQVKQQGIVYVPQKEEGTQKPAEVFVFAPPGLLRVKALIEKYQIVTS